MLQGVCCLSLEIADALHRFIPGIYGVTDDVFNISLNLFWSVSEILLLDRTYSTTYGGAHYADGRCH